MVDLRKGKKNFEKINYIKYSFNISQNKLTKGLPTNNFEKQFKLLKKLQIQSMYSCLSQYYYYYCSSRRHKFQKKLVCVHQPKNLDNSERDLQQFHNVHDVDVDDDDWVILVA